MPEITSPKKAKRSTGPRNFSVGRLRRPPNSKHKGRVGISICRVVEELESDKHGYGRLLCTPEIYYCGGTSDDSFIVDPNAELAFWLSQNSHHSVIFYKDKHYALMGVSKKFKQDGKDALGYRCRRTTGRILHILLMEPPPELVQFVDNQIAEIAFGNKGSINAPL